MSLKPKDFDLGRAKWDLMATVNKAIEEGKSSVVFDCKTLTSKALTAEELDPFGGIPELEDGADG
jgi:hypothetical protein